MGEVRKLEGAKIDVGLIKMDSCENNIAAQEIGHSDDP